VHLTYQSISQDPFSQLNACARRVQIRSHILAILVRRLVEKDSVHSKCYTRFCIDASAPPCIRRNFLSNFCQVSLAVFDAYITYCAYIRLSIQFRNLTSIVLIWQREGCTAWPVVRIEDDRESERRIGRNAKNGAISISIYKVHLHDGLVGGGESMCQDEVGYE
jgi:hypothetical protein